MSSQLEIQNINKVDVEKEKETFSLDASMPTLNEIKVAQTNHTSLSQVVSLKEDKVEQVKNTAKSFVDQIKGAAAFSTEASKLSNDIYALGNSEMEASGTVTNKVLDRPIKELKNGEISGAKGLSTSLTDLRSTVEALDPTKMNSFFVKIKVMGVNVPVPGFLPGVNRLKSYAEQYESSESVINSIVESLDNSKDMLFRDIAQFEIDKENIIKLIENLEYYLVLAKELDAGLEALVISEKMNNPEKAKFIEEEMLFPARQKVMDLTQRITLNMQALLIFNGLVKTDRELVKGIDRSKNITISALKTAIATAFALNNQKQALNQLESVEKVTDKLILQSSEMFKENTAEIYKRSASAAVNLETLKKSFQNVYTTLDTISNFKSSALTNMKDLIQAMEEETQKAKPYIERAINEHKANH